MLNDFAGIPKVALAGMLVFAMGCGCSLYIGFRANGWKSVLPFQHGDSTLTIYRRMIRNNEASSWPLWSWIGLQLTGAALFAVGIVHQVK